MRNGLQCVGHCMSLGNVGMSLGNCLKPGDILNPATVGRTIP